jgi:hypothetical protein
MGENGPTSVAIGEVIYVELARGIRDRVFSECSDLVRIKVRAVRAGRRIARPHFTQ